MKFYLLRLVFAALTIFFAAPGSATVISTRPTPTRGASVYAPSGKHLTRSVQGLRADQITSVTYPVGCVVNGSNSFVGEALSNYAGGAPYVGAGVSPGAGVMAGQKNEACDAFSAIGAGSSNIIGGDSTSQGSVIGAGLRNNIEGSGDAFIGAGFENLLGSVPNLASGISNYSAIVAGYDNTIASQDSFIGAGFQNSIIATDIVHYGEASVIAGGESNVISGPYAGIGSGMANSIGSAYSVIGGGSNNQETGFSTTIGGGQGNNASGQVATIGGGYNNVASGIQATVGGGYGNMASGRNSVIAGGAYNVAGGLDSFAAGNTAHATYDGTFVWSDYSASSGITSTGPNQFLARAAGGFYLYTSASLRSGVRLAPGSGAWSSLSDRAAKTGIMNVDDASILAKVAALPVSEWSYTAQGGGVRHIGPMAQDFRAAFGLGEDDRHITTIDEEGVALAAIKALQAEVAEKDQQLAKLRRSDKANFDAKYARLEQRLDALEVTTKS